MSVLETRPPRAAVPNPDRIGRGMTDAGPIGAGLFEASQDCVKLISLDGALLAMNVNGMCLMEIGDFEPLRGLPWASLWPQADQATVSAAVARARTGDVARFTAACPTAAGTPKIWDVVVSPVFDAAGQTVQIVSTSHDVTEQHRVREENALLSRELAHRIKNFFAVVDGVVALSARQDAAAGPFAEALRQRLADLGRAMDYVSPAPEGGRGALAPASLQGLLRTLLRPYGATEGPARQMSIEGEDPLIGASATTAMALIVTELATNALKYGALRTAQGRVEVRISRASDKVVVAWSEHGDPVEAPGAADGEGGFGQLLLDKAVTRLLRGSLERSWRPDGLDIQVSAPAAAMAG